MRLGNRCRQLALGDVLDFFVERENHVHAAFSLRFSTVEPALACVGHHDDLFALAPDLAIQFVFDPTQPLFIEIDEAQYMRCEVALRIDALIFFLEVDASQIQRLHRFLFVWRQLARNPHKRVRGCQSRFKHFARSSQNTGEQLGRQLLVAKLGRHRECRIHRDAHCQRVHVAIVDRSALGRDFDHALLLPLRPGQVFAVKKKLQVSEPTENGGHPQECQAGNDQQSADRFAAGIGIDRLASTPGIYR